MITDMRSMLIFGAGLVAGGGATEAGESTAVEHAARTNGVKTPNTRPQIRIDSLRFLKRRKRVAENKVRPLVLARPGIEPIELGLRLAQTRFRRGKRGVHHRRFDRGHRLARDRFQVHRFDGLQ